jgi:hypothetical protein
MLPIGTLTHGFVMNKPPSPPRDCVVIVMEGGFRRNRQSGSSALECGRLKVWVIGVLRNGILFMGLEGPEAGRWKVSALKLRHLTACSVLEQRSFLVNCDTAS